MRPCGPGVRGVLLGGLLHGAVACQFPSYQLEQSTDVAGGGAGGASSAGQGAVGGTAGDLPRGGQAGTGGEPSALEPIAIQLDATTENELRESQTSGGTEYTDLCPSPQVLIGVQGTTADPADVVRSVQGVCGATSVVESAATGKYEVKITQTSLLTERGLAHSLVQLALCPPDQLLIGFNGHAGSYIDALEFRCASLAIVGSSPAFELVVRAEEDTPALGGPGGSGLSYAECSNERIAIGQSTRMTEAITAFGLLCVTPSLRLE
jgi:hypothetical protein